MNLQLRPRLPWRVSPQNGRIGIARATSKLVKLDLCRNVPRTGAEYAVSVLLLLTAAALAIPNRVQACSCAPAPIYRSMPDSGATGVELNRVVVVMGLYDPESIELTDAAGRPVAVEVFQAPVAGGCRSVWSELRPRAQLEPNTSYTVRVQPPTDIAVDVMGYETTATFTTGTAVLAEASLDLPVAAASVVHSLPEVGWCGSPFPVVSCLSVTDYDAVEIIARKDDEILMHWLLHEAESGTADLTFGLSEIPDCLELRRWTPAGQRSEPLRICGDALHARESRQSDFGKYGGLRCANGKVGVDPEPPASIEPPAAGVDLEPAGGGLGGQATDAEIDAGLADLPQPSAADGGSVRARDDDENAEPSRTRASHGCSATSAALPDDSPAWAIAFALLLVLARARLSRRHRARARPGPLASH